ncbi:MAG: glycosyltransferase [Anaerolineaceae bacterium]|nr:MAG: glycosyltransferase [Anaerolineaceae bacterium]
MKKVSVIIPVYNVENYLKDCLMSVVGQPISNIEIICVNDGSTDKSKDILERFAQKHDNIKIIDQENQGLSCARNVGLMEAQGEYVYFLDSDDMMEEDSLTKMYEYSRANELDVLYFDAKTVYDLPELKDKYMNYQNAYSRSRAYGIYFNGQELMKEFVESKEYYVSVCLQFIRRDFLLKEGIIFYPHILHEDNLFTFQCMMLAGRVAHIADYFFIRRIRHNSIMTIKRKFENFHGLYTTHKEMLTFLHKAKTNSVLYDSIVFSILDDVYNMACNIYIYNLDKEERNKCELYGKAEYYQVKQNIENRMPLYKKNEYPCPFYLLERDCRIVLYGAGNIGRKYYIQINESKYATIVDWVDKNYRKLQEEQLPVNPIISLVNKEFDYIFIAVADEKSAKEIRNELHLLGISNNRIIWNGNEYRTAYLKQMEMLNKRVDIYSQVWEQPETKCYLLMTPEHGNLGDYAIALSERRFIREDFLHMPLIEITTDEWIKYEDLYKAIIHNNDIIFISGGGYLGNMWTSGGIVKKLIASFPNNIKIMFPNTLTYIDNNADDMKEEAEFYRMQEGLYIFARDKASYDRLYHYQYRDKEYLGLFPDMALGLDYTNNSFTKREGIMLCFRNDLEKVCSDDVIESIKQILIRKGEAVIESDMHLKRTIKSRSGESELQKMIEQFQKAKLVITDRLHGMIFAAITATPCIAFNNSTGKIKGVYQWIEHLPYIVYMESEDFSEDKLDKIQAISECVYDNITIMNQLQCLGLKLQEITNRI